MRPKRLVDSRQLQVEWIWTTKWYFWTTQGRSCRVAARFFLLYSYLCLSWLGLVGAVEAAA